VKDWMSQLVDVKEYNTLLSFKDLKFGTLDVLTKNNDSSIDLVGDVSTVLKLEAAGGEATNAKAEDLVAFILGSAKTAFGRPRE
jgi:hypothetical protein